MKFHVFVDETRPLLQWSRITAFELQRNGVPATLICDNMAATVMAQGKVQAVIVGTDRVTRQDMDGLCTLTLNRPDKLNALDTPTFEDLDAQLAALENENDRIGCVVVRGAGRAFCAGADLDALGRTPSRAFRSGARYPLQGRSVAVFKVNPPVLERRRGFVASRTATPAAGETHAPHETPQPAMAAPES